MPQVWDQGRTPVWIFRARPLDLETGIIRNEWFATTEVETDEPFEGWLEFSQPNTRANLAHEDQTSLDLGGSFVVGILFRTDTVQDATLLSKSVMGINSGSTPGYLMGLLSAGVGTVRGSISDGTSRSDADSIQGYADGQWHTLVYTLESTVHRLRFDGVEVASVGTLVSPGANQVDFTVGAGSNPFVPDAPEDEFVGDIERVIVSNIGGTTEVDNVETLLGSRDLTTSVVDDGVGLGVVLAWPLNEGFERFLQDVSGTSNHGTAGPLNPQSAFPAPAWSAIAPPPMTIPSLLISPFSVSASLLRGGSQVSTHALPSFGAVRLANPDGEIDRLARLSWDHRLTEHRLGFLGDLVTDYDTI